MTAQELHHRTLTAAVAGGTLTGSLWNPDAPGTPVLAIHGITANHTSFQSLAERLDAPVAAFDLRGRGRSRDVGAPHGLVQHAADMAEALQQLGWSRVRVVGHSMGAFVAVRLAERAPDIVQELVLLDGGLPVEIQPDASPEALLGPAVERLTKQFASPEAYREFWHRHPAFGSYWNPYIERYVDYDLIDIDGVLRPAAMPDAVVANMVELDGRDGYTEALEALAVPTTLFLSPRGLMDETPGLYTPEWVQQWRGRLPETGIIDVPESNHYTVLLSDAVQTVTDQMKERA